MIPLPVAGVPPFVWKIAGVAAIVGGAWIYGHHEGYSSAQEKYELEASQQREAYDARVLAEKEKARKAEAAAAQALAVVDQKHKELADAQTASEDLRRKLAAGTVRVRLNGASCAGGRELPANPAAPGVGDGKAGCELDGETAQSLEGIAEDGNRAARKLSALQDYITTVVLPTCSAAQ